jgi:hypothetical protein
MGAHQRFTPEEMVALRKFADDGARYGAIAATAKRMGRTPRALYTQISRMRKTLPTFAETMTRLQAQETRYR